MSFVANILAQKGYIYSQTWTYPTCHFIEIIAVLTLSFNLDIGEKNSNSGAALLF